MLKSIHIYSTWSSVTCFCCLCGKPMFSCVVFRVTTCFFSFLIVFLFSRFICFANASNPYVSYTFLRICSQEDFSFLLFLSVSHDSCSRARSVLSKLHYIYTPFSSILCLTERFQCISVTNKTVLSSCVSTQNSKPYL